MIPIRPADEILDQPFWRHLANGRLFLNRCDKCGRFRHPPGPVCPECRHIGESWAAVSGRATLKSFTIIHHPVHIWLGPVVPYTVTLVKLEEGPTLVSGLPPGDNTPLQVGMPLVCQVIAIDERYALPFFKPIGHDIA